MRRCIQFVCSGMAIGLAVILGIVVSVSQIPNDIHIRLEEWSKFTPSSLTAEQIETYNREGVVFVPGLLSEQQAVQLGDSAEFASSRMFSIADLFASSRYKNVGFDIWRTSPEVASLSLQALPKIAAQVLTDSKDEGGQVRFRLLRDAIFQYAPGGIGCGWHVDDHGFWPTEEDTSGPTIWIALDDMKSSEGGGLSVMNRTLFQQLGPSNVTESGCREAVKRSTCDLDSTSPECHAKLEASKSEWDLKPGDAIIWDRWTFHRGVPSVSQDVDDINVKRRYSVRYIPYGAKALGGLHPSIEEGKPFDSPFYPQVWPSLVDSEMQALEYGLEPDLKLANLAFKIAKYKLKALLTSKK